MKNVKTMTALGLTFALIFGLGISSSGFSEEKAVTTFKQENCNECHAWKSQGVAIKAEDGDSGGDAAKTPDLSSLTKETLGQSNPKTFLHDFLLKKAELKGKKHKKRFKGSDAELDELIAFLLAQKK